MEEPKDHSVLDSFGVLREGTEKAQIGASLAILRHLSKKQEESGEECCKELRLAINRIVRSLGSPRPRSRRGYYATFVGLIKKFPTLSVQVYCDAIEKELKIYNSNEETDVNKGLVIAYGALIDSGAIFSANSKQLQQVTSKILSIATKKFYLKSAVNVFIVDLIKKLDSDNFEVIWTEIHDKMVNNKNKLSLDDYYLLMVAQERFPMKINEKYLNKMIGAPQVLHANLFDNITDHLLNVPRVSCIESPMHQEFLRGLTSSKKFVKKFWELVDKNLQSPTMLRMILALKLFCCMAKQVIDINLIKHMLTPNFVLVLERVQEVEKIEEARKSAIDEFAKIVSNKNSLNSKSVIKIVQSLYFYPGSFRFFQGPGMKVFRSLRNNLEEKSVKAISTMFHDVLTDKSTIVLDTNTTNRAWKEVQKKTAVQILVDLLSHQSVSNHIDWKIELLKTVIDIGFFSKSLSPKLTTAARKYFFAALDHQFKRFTDLRAYLTGLASYFDGKLSGSDYFAVSFTKEMRKEWSRMMSVVTVIDENKTDSGKLESTAFHVMFLLLGMTLFKEPEKSIEYLKELQNIYKHRNDVVEEGSDTPHWTDVTVDLILSLLSQSNKLNRHIISKIFIYFCPYLSSDNIHQLLTVLNPNSKNPMIEMEAENMNISAERKDNNHSDEDSHDEDDDEDDDDDDEEESDISEDEMEDEGTDYDKLRAVVSDALGNAAALTDTESVDVDDMDEEEGKKLDERLSEAFRLMKQQQQKKQAVEQKDLSDFQFRVLDLLGIWSRTEPDLSVLLDTLVTVLMLLESTMKGGENLELLNRLKTFLKELTSLKKFKIAKDFDREQLVQLIEKVTSKEDRTNSVYISLAPQIVAFCTFIVKISMRDIKHMKKVRQRIVLLYKELLDKCFTTNNSVIPVGLFQSVLELTWEGGLDLIEDVSGFVFNDSIRYFQKCQGLRLLEAFFRNKRLLTAEFVESNEKRLKDLSKKVIKKGLKELKKDFSEKYYHQFVQVKAAIKKAGTVYNDSVDWVSVESDLYQIRQSSGKRPANNNPQKRSNNKRKKIAETEKGEGGEDMEASRVENLQQPSNGDLNGNQPISPAKKRKKKNTRELTKKDIKIRRAKETSKGFDNGISFSKVTNTNFLYNNTTFIDDDDDEN